MTWPGPSLAVKVLRKNDSPPSIRLRPLNMPPEAPVARVTFCWATMAPGSALMASPWVQVCDESGVGGVGMDGCLHGVDSLPGAGG